MQIPTDWSLDGRLVLYDAERNGQRDLWSVPVASAQSARPFLETSANELQGQFSPDVKWVAYTSDESGAYEVYVRRYPGGEGMWRVSTNGGAQPRWRRDGRELFYLAPDGALMAADVKADGTTFETEAPRRLFNTGITGAFVDRRNHYAVTRDGQRFLVNVTDEDDTWAPIIVVVHWDGASKP
jgi:eukaryotic-like serine/threonine-protein kinase